MDVITLQVNPVLADLKYCIAVGRVKRSRMMRLYLRLVC
jgi:hypothetical protein